MITERSAEISRKPRTQDGFGLLWTFQRTMDSLIFRFPFYPTNIFETACRQRLHGVPKLQSESVSTPLSQEIHHIFHITHYVQKNEHLMFDNAPYNANNAYCSVYPLHFMFGVQTCLKLFIFSEQLHQESRPNFFRNDLSSSTRRVSDSSVT